MHAACPVCFARKGNFCTKHDGSSMLRCHPERREVGKATTHLDPEAVRWAAARDLSQIGEQDPWTEARIIVERIRGVAVHTLIAALGDRIMHYRQGKDRNL